MITFIAILGWATAGFLALGLYSCRKNKLGWFNLYQEKCGVIRELEHKHMVADMDHKSLEWYRDEVTRLTIKCDAICRQARRMKGRGKATCQIDPSHNF